MKNNTKHYIKELTLVSAFVAVICIVAQIAIPISVIPITLQGFAVALCGYMLGKKKSLIAVCVYLILGAVGAPVFANFNGGFHMLLSYTGGFLWGFIPYAFFCALSQKAKLAIPFGIMGVILCHLMGTIQYSLVSKASIWLSFLVASLPFILKDVILTVTAYFVARRINKITKIRG